MYNSQGQVLGAAISVLPATAAYTLLPTLHSTQTAVGVAGFVGMWAVAYISINAVMRVIKK